MKNTAILQKALVMKLNVGAAALLLFAMMSISAFAETAARYRGAMIAPNDFSAGDLEVFADQWNGNLIRWQLNFEPETTEEYLDLLVKECEKLDKMIPLLKEHGVKVCLDLHTPPGGFNEDYILRIFIDKRFSEMFVQIWERLATRYAGQSVIWGYDLMNEPVDGIPSKGDYHISWRDLAEKTIRRIREIDPDVPIVFEPANYASERYFKDLEPLDLPNVLYSCHVYVPLELTHQNVMKDFTDPVTYPGEINGEYWDKERLRLALSGVIAFQQKYHVPIYIGEFSAIRWAPNNSAYNYLKDAIELFEEYGWDWTYHAFREWTGWSVEYTSDKNDDKPASEPTDRELLLRSYFQKNLRQK